MCMARPPKRQQAQKKQIYIIFWFLIIALVGLIGWFTYLLIRPEDTATTTKQVNQPVNILANTTPSKKKNKASSNANANATNLDAVNSNTNTNETNTNANNNSNVDAGLVEPDTSADTDANTNADATTKTVTLYFPKTGSACGEVSAVQRDIEPTDDIYGQIIIEDMHGPTEAETGYSNAVTAAIHLRQVQYTADGPLITVNEAYDELDDCTQATVDAQLIKTANAMFELPEDTAGQVVVGSVEDTSTNDNTNTESTE